MNAILKSREVQRALCVQCDRTRVITLHGRCETCGSDAVMHLRGWTAPEQKQSA
jgi:hypothetical protein